jgi:hypothetical protein
MGGDFAYEYELDGESPYRKAVVSSYFILTTLTTVGYGDISPTSKDERIFMTVILLFGVAFYAYIMGTFTSTIADYNSTIRGKDQLQELNIWIRSIEKLHGKLPIKLKQEINEHYFNYWDHDLLKDLAKSYWLYNSPDDFVSIDQAYLKDLPIEHVHSIYDHLFRNFYYRFKT